MNEQQQLGRYELGAEIGRGSTGVVYKARDPIIDRVVAIKTIDFRRLGSQQADAQERFFQEAKSAGRLSHPNIVTIYDAGQAQGCAYIAMELLEGCSLREMLDEHPPLTVGRALEITAQVARGLAYAHEHGIVHRDVKPANVILVGSRRAKITDFGIARLNTAGNTADRELAGSPKYMSPEQIRGDEIDGRSDLFSLGSMLYEMLTARPPFNGNNVAAIMQAVREAAPKAPSSINAKVPAEIDKLIARMLAKSPDERHPSARALLRDLTMLLKKYSLKPLGDANRDEARERAKRIKEARRRRTSEGDTTMLMPDPVRKRRERKKSLPMPVFYGMAAAAVAILVVVAFLMRTGMGEPAAPVSLNAMAVESSAPASVAKTSRPPILPVAQDTAAVSSASSPPALAAESPAGTAVVSDKPKSVAKPRKTAAPTVAAAPLPVVEPATVVIAASPWGEVFIDGESRGTTPPLSNISLPPGKHRIEIRNGNLAPYAAEINVGAGETRRIKHKFE